MFRTAHHPSLEKAVSEAETLHRLRIKRATNGVLLWIFRDRWLALHLFKDRQTAEDYLLNKLPKIEPTRGDINRPPPPTVIWEGYP